MKRQDDRSPGGAVLGVLARLFLPVFVLLATYLAFVQYNNYELWRPEIALVGLLVVAVGLALGLVVALWPTTLGFGLVVVLLGLFLMVQVTTLNYWTVQIVYRDNPLAALSGAGALAALIVLAWRIRGNLLLILSGGFATVCVSMLVLPPDRQVHGSRFERAHDGQEGPPLLIHFVLDEHIGIEGIPDDIPGGGELRKDLKAFYQRYGFTLYGRAFSHWPDTASSLATSLNGRMRPDGLLKRKAGTLVTFSLSENLWFETLANRGYGVRIYQTDYLDFCRAQPTAVVSCYEVPANSISYLRDIELPAWEKAQVVLYTFVYAVKTGIGTATYTSSIKMGALAMPGMIAQISEDVVRNPTGVAIFAHFLIPHYSHIFDDRCGIKQDIQSWSTRANGAKFRAPINTHLTRRERYGAYFQQVRCLYRILGEFLDDLERAGLLDQATIIFQGDHGSRISIAEPSKLAPELISVEDIVDQYSTLYAVKLPGTPASYELELSASQALFSKMFLGRDQSQSGPFVFLNWYNWATDEAPESLTLPDHAFGSGTKNRVSSQAEGPIEN